MADAIAPLADIVFLTGGGAVGALMREHDWSNSPLGAPETWPQSLRSALSICLNSPGIRAIYWGPEFRLFYNDAYRPFLDGRHPWALGRPMTEIWPTMWQALTASAGKVYETGEGIVVENQRLMMEREVGLVESFWFYSFAPIRGETGQVDGIFLTALDTTERVLSERRKGFRLALEERLRDLSDADAIMAAALLLLGEHLGLDRVGYTEIIDDAVVRATGCHVANGMTPLTGSFPLESFGEVRIARQRQGVTEVCDDVQADPEQDDEVWAAIDTRAFISVPLVREGTFRASLYVNSRTPRRWTPEEVALIEQVAARTWDAVERARSEAALRESEARFRLMADASPQIVWITDRHGRMQFFNRKFTDYTGEPGREATPAEIAAEFMHPEDGADVVAAFEAALARGEPFEVEHRIRSAAGEYRWFLARAEPYRDPETSEILRWFGASVDIHDRRQAEAELRASEERLSFLDRLHSETAALAEADAVLATTTRLLGEHLGLSLCAYADMDEDGDGFTIRGDWAAPGSTSIVGHYRLADFGKLAVRNLGAGEPLVVNDNLRELAPEEAAIFQSIGIAATICMPLVKEGRLTALMAIHDKVPRVWTVEELSLLRDVTTRSWAHVERVGAVAELRASQAQLAEERRALATLVEHLPMGVILVDRDGRTLLHNSAYARIVPEAAIPSRLPDAEERWIGYDEKGQRIRRDRFAGARALRGEVVANAEFLHRAPDGQETWTHISGVPLRDAAGKIAGAICVVVDIDAQKRAEERLQLATEAAELGIFDIDLTTMVMDWDLRQRELWGVGPDEVITDEIFVSGIHLDDRDLVRNAVARAFEPDGNHLYSAEYRVLPHGRGDERWVAAMGRVHFDSCQPARLIGTTQDITDRKRAEVALHESEARLRELNETLEQRVAEALAERKLLADVFESTDAMMSVADPNLRLLAFNRPYATEVERLGGRRPRVGNSIPDLYAGQPELAAPVEANWSRAVRGEVFTVTEEHGDPERYSRIYERRFEPLYDRGGRLVGAYQYATDVTERLRDQRRAEDAEAARREADALYRAYFQNSAEGLFVIGVLPDGSFSLDEANPEHRRVLAHFGLEPAPGKPLDEQLPPEAAEAVSVNYRRVLETGEVQRYKESAPIGGQVMHFETVLVPVRDETAHITKIVGSGRDMTAQVQAEEALRQSQKMEAMGQLTGGVAHDFNNLLTPIIASLDMLLRRGVGSERERRLMDGALQSAERAKVLVQRLLAFARRQPLQPGPVDIPQLVSGMAELVASTSGPRIDVRMELPDDLPPALADANQLEMAVLNLAVNARDAMPEAGVLTISAARESVHGAHQATLRPGHYVRLSVTDTGSGMDEATLARAVEPFFSTKGIGKGTGLGLSMVQGLTEQLGGGLTITSRPGQGTTVTLWLPISTVAVEEYDRAQSTATPPKAQGTALLVDDEDLVRMSTADMLMDLGYEVVEAQSADEALRLVGEGLHPDLVVTDHLMPGLSGLDLAHNLRSRRPDLPVLIVSGYAEMDGIAPGFARLTKPFRSAELLEKISSLKPDGNTA